MHETDRENRNTTRLQEMYPAFRVRVEAVLKEMEALGYRPRIQDAWRSPSEQMQAFRLGYSQVQYGFHNVTGAKGEKEALAADILDDDRPLTASTEYKLHLAAAAEENGLITGIRWGLSDKYIEIIDEAIAAQNWQAPTHLGWDPMHVEVNGISIREAKAGKRPLMPGEPGPVEPTVPSGGAGHTDDSGNTGGEETNQPTDGGTPEAGGPSTPPQTWTTKRHFKVEETDGGAVTEYDLGNALRPTTLLPVPYVSQFGEGADVHKKDCGAACAVMLFRAYQNIEMTPDEFYTHFNIQGDPYLSATQIQNALRSMGLLTEFHSGLSIQDLFVLLASSKPTVVLLRYKVFFEAGLTEKSFQGPHFSVVVGMDPKYIYIHDPLYTNPAAGEAHPYPIELFWQAWKEVALDSSFPNPECSAIIPTSGIGFQVARRVKVNTPVLNVRSGPGLNMPIVGKVHAGDVLPVSRENAGWAEIGFNQWISLSYTIAVP
jgi:hypothetical protein